MLYNYQRKKLCRHLLVGGALCVAGLGAFSCSDTYDLDTEQPSGLNSIYGYMQSKGNFKNYLQLIDDLGMKEILSKTGSKTLFVADDDAFAEFYRANSWGVTRYEELSLAQKKMLLNSSMIDNPYPTSMLSTASSGTSPVKGEVCRRTASLSIYDSVAIAGTATGELPDTRYWNCLKSTHDSIVLFMDASGSNPMIHFTPMFIQGNKLESSDIDFLYNDPAGTRQSDDATVNDAKIIDANIFCKNGFVHQVDKVITPLDNMAQIINSNPKMSIFNSILERFSSPAYSRDLTQLYNENKGTEIDSVYEKRFFSSRSKGSTSSQDRPYTEDKDGNTFNYLLKFDPGWNTYVSNEFSIRNGMMEDMAVMLVPTNEAMQNWWDNGGGQVIKDFYGTMENVPDNVFYRLINNGMLPSLVKAVPSRFGDVNNDAQMAMGITTADVDSVYLGCNGAVYLTNKVFAPMRYSSVLFPTVVNETMTFMDKIITDLQYDAYLNSMVSTYSFFIPTNDGMLSYIDPVTYGQTESQLWEFRYDPEAAASRSIKATVYSCVLNEDGSWEKGEQQRVIEGSLTGSGANSQLVNRLEDLLNNIIVIGEVQEGKTYYQTKGNNYVKVGGRANVAGEMTVSGSWQVERNRPLTVSHVYNMENGRSYVIDGPLMGTRKSVADVVSEIDDFSDFYHIMSLCGLVNTNNTKDSWTSVSNLGNIIYTYSEGSSKFANYIFDSYHYTMYIPTNAAMQKAYELGLPTLEDMEEAEKLDADNAELNAANGNDELPTDSAAHISSIWRDFVKYHTHSNSVFVDEGFADGNYESAKSGLTKNEDGTFSPGRPYKLAVNSSANSMTVTDLMGHTYNVDSRYNNLMAREYWVKTNNIDNSSFIVVHGIDGPLMYDKDQFIYSDRNINSGEDSESKHRK